MADKYEEMARQMKADGVNEEMIARFIAEEMEEDEFRRGKGVTEIEALRGWRKVPEHIRKLLLANALCHDCGTTEFAPGYTLRIRHGCVSASDHSWLASPSARAANHISSRRNTSLRIVNTSCDEKTSCAPFLLTSESLNSRITYRRSFGRSLASSSSTTTVPPCSPSDLQTPSANFWTVSQAEPAQNAARRRHFPRSAEPTANNPRQKPYRSPGPWRNRRPFPAKPPRTRGGATAGRAAVTASADAGANRRGRCARHRGERTSVPCSPASRAENGLEAPPPGAAARDPHPARCLAQPAGKAAGVPPRGSEPFICTGWTPPPC